MSLWKARLADRLPRVPAPLTPQQALGRAVAERRQELGLTQEELALRSDLHQRWISNVENGHRNPSYSSLQRLAAGLGLRASELVARAEACTRESPYSRP
jgi:transcriptional regulator with XRE-family HTH domain